MAPPSGSSSQPTQAPALRPEVEPARAPASHWLVGGAAGVAVGAAALVGVMSATVAVPTPIVIETRGPAAIAAAVEAPALAAPVEALVEPPPAAPSRASELALVIEAGGVAYMALTELRADGERSDDDAPALPRHRRPELVERSTVVAAVDGADLAPELAAWRDRQVRVGASCTTSVTGFALVARLEGDPFYLGEGGDDLDDLALAWTAEQVMRHGAVVVAARLAGCHGAYARDAALPAVVELAPVSAPADELAAAARARLVASAPAQELVPALTAEGHPPSAPFDGVEFATQVVRHPGTGVTFVSIHGVSDGGCGEAERNVWGLYRVGDAGLETVVERSLGTMYAVDALLDLDGDGELELLGEDWLGLDRIVARADGREVVRLDVPFYGCPC
ncbi:MAG: hypothetical protein R2939_06010 [Kofleriaceae bacterium]